MTGRDLLNWKLVSLKLHHIFESNELPNWLQVEKLKSIGYNLNSAILILSIIKCETTAHV